MMSDEAKTKCVVCDVQQEDVGPHAGSPPLCPVCYIRTVDPTPSRGAITVEKLEAELARAVAGWGEAQDGWGRVSNKSLRTLEVNGELIDECNTLKADLARVTAERDRLRRALVEIRSENGDAGGDLARWTWREARQALESDSDA